MDPFRDWVLNAWESPYVRALLVILVSFAVGKIVDLVLTKIVVRLVRRSRSELDDRLVTHLHRPIFLSVVLIGIKVAGAIALPPAIRGTIDAILNTLLVLIWTVTGFRVVTELRQSMSRAADRSRWIDARMLPLFDNTLKILILVSSAYGLLVAWNLNLAPWLASAGIAGIAIGFAAKDTLANLFGGISVIIDAPYKIGDFITLDTGERGRVEKIGLRSTRLLTRDDVEITLPNSVIANARIVNESGGPWEKTRVAINVGVAYGSDVDRVREVLMRSARSVDCVLDDPEPRIRFVEMGDSALIFRVLCWIDEPVLRGLCIDALNTVVYKTLTAEGITIPFPQRDVHIHTAPEGAG